MTAALDPQRSVAATGLVADFHAAGGLGWADVHAARQLTYLYGDTDERVALAVGLCVRALRAGSVCLELTAVAESTAGFGDEAVSIPDELWPEPAASAPRRRSRRPGPCRPAGRSGASGAGGTRRSSAAG